MTFDIFLLTRN